MSDISTIGKVVMKLNVQSSEYSIESSIDDEWENILFYLFMIDKILVDCTDRNIARNILANSMAVVIGEGRVYTEIENVYKRFTHLSEITSYEFKMECEFLRKTFTKGDHVYVLTNYKPPFVPNIMGKVVIIFAIYTMYLREHFSSESVEKFRIMLRLLYEEYQGGSNLPGMTTITRAPISILNKL